MSTRRSEKAASARKFPSFTAIALAGLSVMGCAGSPGCTGSPATGGDDQGDGAADGPSTGDNDAEPTDGPSGGTGDGSPLGDNDAATSDAPSDSSSPDDTDATTTDGPGGTTVDSSSPGDNDATISDGQGGATGDDSSPVDNDATVTPSSPGYMTTPPAAITTAEGGVPVYYTDRADSFLYPACSSTSVFLAAQCRAQYDNADTGNAYITATLAADDAIDKYDSYTTPCSATYGPVKPQYSELFHNSDNGGNVAQCSQVEIASSPSSDCSTGYVDMTGTCTAVPNNIPLGQVGSFGTQGGTIHDGTNCNGMCVPNASKMLASLQLNDIPVGYKPQKGPDAQIKVSYNYLDTVQPASPIYGNLGPRWTHSFSSYVQDDPAWAVVRVTRYVAGGGMVDYSTETSSFNGTTSAFGPEIQGGAVLQYIISGGAYAGFTLTNPDGSVQTFDHSDGATTFPRKWMLTKVADPQGNYLTLSYDSSNRLASIEDAEARYTTFCYDPTRSNCLTYSGSSMLISQITDPFGRSAVFSYDSYGRLSSIQDVLGIKSSFTYDGTPVDDAGADGGTSGDPYFISELTTPYGNSTFAGGVDYGASSRWLELTDPDGYTERVEYNQTNSAIGATESSTPSGMTVENGAYNQYNTFYWDKYVWPTYGTGPGKDYTKAEITHWAIANTGIPSPIPASVKKPLENRVYYTYPGQDTLTPDLVGTYDQPAAVGRVLDDGTSQVSTFTYNNVGFPTETVDPLGRTTTYAYAPNGIDLITVQQLTASPSTFTTIASYSGYNAAHEPGSYTDAAGQVWLYCYNGAGQLTQSIDPANYVSGSSCASYGQVGTQYNIDPTTGRLLSVTNALGNTQVSYAYPATCSNTGLVNCDLPTSVTDSEGRTVSYSRDALDRVTTTAYPDGTTDVDDYTFQSGTYAGTPSLEVRKHTDRLGRVTLNAYDFERRLKETTDPLSYTVQYGYFADGTLNTLTDQNGHMTTWAIDVESRPMSKTFADSTAITYGYESTTSRVKSVTDALNQMKTFSYDEANEVTGINYAGAANPTPNVSFTWDPYFPRRTVMTDGNGSTAWAYVPPGTNGALSPYTETPPFSNATETLAYDVDGRPNSLQVGSTPAETWNRDPLGRATSHVTALGAWTYAFLGQTGQPTSRTLGATGISTSWSYDTNTNDRRLIGIANAATGATPGPRSYTFGYGTAADGGGPQNPYDIMASTQTSGGNGSWPSQSWANTYDYDDRLKSATGSTAGEYAYGLDGPGNLTTWTATGGGPPNSPTYNNVNELNSAPFAYNLVGDETADASRAYNYDAENRVIEIDYPGTSNKTSIVYDGLGRRVQVAYDNGSTTTTARFAWCGGQLCEQRDGSDNITARLYPEGEYQIGGTVTLVYMPDQLGSVRDVVNVSGPSVVYSADYSPYGAPATTSGSTVPVFGFAGLVADPNSGGLLYSATRFLDPSSGRWIHRDPIAESGGIDLYAYAGGNPVSTIDPSGLKQSVFFFGSAQASTISFVGPVVEQIALGGLDFGNGVHMYGGSINAVGGDIKVGGEGIGGTITSTAGVETLTNGQSLPITLVDVSAGPQFFTIADMEVGAGTYSSGKGAEETGWYVFGKGGVFGENLTGGFGVSNELVVAALQGLGLLPQTSGTCDWKHPVSGGQ